MINPAHTQGLDRRVLAFRRPSPREKRQENFLLEFPA